MQEFYINKGATLPMLKMELINDGRYDYEKFYSEMQMAKSKTFTMTNLDNGLVKIAKSDQVYLLPKENSCSDEYYLCYKWREKDTKIPGTYSGSFTITLNSGEILIVPIQEALTIYIQ